MLCANMVLSAQVQVLDLASLDSVRSFAAAWQRQQRPLHILVNNAGIFSMGGVGAMCAPPDGLSDLLQCFAVRLV